jgi:hypothetical protein
MQSFRILVPYFKLVGLSGPKAASKFAAPALDSDLLMVNKNSVQSEVLCANRHLRLLLYRILPVPVLSLERRTFVRAHDTEVSCSSTYRYRFNYFKIKKLRRILCLVKYRK